MKKLIVLKAPQDKVLAALRWMAGIIERRHTLPILRNVLIGHTPAAGMQFSNDPAVKSSKEYDARAIPARGALVWKPRGIAGFFCVAKLNLRNAP